MPIKVSRRLAGAGFSGAAAAVTLLLITCALPPSARLPEARPAVAETTVDLEVEAILAGMSLREKLAQRFFIYLPRDLPPYAVEAFLSARRPGGVLLYPWNFDSPSALVELTSAAREAGPKISDGSGRTWTIIPFVSGDHEGGRVAGLATRDYIRLPSQARMASFNSVELVRVAGYVMGLQLKALGFNMSFSPVFDVSPDADDSIIGDRSFGPDPTTVTRLGLAAMEGLEAAGIVAVPKHFPGHGGTRVDSHGTLPVIEKPLSELLAHDVAPFAAAVRAGARAVMTAHIRYPALDPDHPATLSSPILNGLLRDQLGFDGIVISDGFEMGALSKFYDTREALRLAFKADVDMILLFHRYDVFEMFRHLESLLASGDLSLDDVDRGLRRVLRLKARGGLVESR